MMFRTVIAISAIAIGVTAAVAQQDPITARKAAMKAIGAQAGQGGKFLKGEEPFDLAKAQNIFVVFATNAAAAPNLFPDSSKTGGETAAAPAIWEKNADFKAKFAKFEADAKAAQANVKDEASFKANFSEVTKNCGGCHETYRLKKS
jgi:cytochrome c556